MTSSIESGKFNTLICSRYFIKGNSFTSSGISILSSIIGVRLYPIPFMNRLKA
jgi:hypothetical protein